MRVTVLIPTYRRPADLLRCLRAIACQERPPEEVLVIARPDDTNTSLALRSAGVPPHRLVPTTRPGQVAALNAGVAAACGDVVAITDDDTAPHPDWVRRIADHFETDANLGGLGGRDWIHEPDGTVNWGCHDTVGRVQWFGRAVGNHHLGVGLAREVDILKGANMSYRREALQAVGFDTRLRGEGAQVCNDMALSLGVKRAGWRLLYDPAVAVDHHIADRQDGGQRGRLDVEGIRYAAFNEALTLTEHQAARWGTLGGMGCAAYGVLIGSAGLPGFVQGARLLLSGRAAVRQTLAATVGRLEAFAYWARGGERRRSEPETDFFSKAG